MNDDSFFFISCGVPWSLKANASSEFVPHLVVLFNSCLEHIPVASDDPLRPYNLFNQTIKLIVHS